MNFTLENSNLFFYVGLTLALSRALCYSGEFWKNEPTLSQMYTLICDCASVACDIIFHVLSILAAKSSLEDVGNERIDLR